MEESALTHRVDSAAAVSPGTKEQRVRQVRHSSRWVGGKDYGTTHVLVHHANTTIHKCEIAMSCLSKITKHALYKQHGNVEFTLHSR